MVISDEGIRVVVSSELLGAEWQRCVVWFVRKVSYDNVPWSEDGGSRMTAQVHHLKEMTWQDVERFDREA